MPMLTITRRGKGYCQQHESSGRNGNPLRTAASWRRVAHYFNVQPCRSTALCLPSVCRWPCAGIRQRNGGRLGRTLGNVPFGILRTHRRKLHTILRKPGRSYWQTRCRATYSSLLSGKSGHSPYPGKRSAPLPSGWVPADRRLRNGRRHLRTHCKLRYRMQIVHGP